MSLLSGVNATEVTALVCSLHIEIGVSFFRLQTLIFLSLSSLAINFPSELKASELKTAECVLR